MWSELVYCAICGGPRSPSSGRLCRHCYLGVCTYRRLIRVLKKILKGKMMKVKYPFAKPSAEELEKFRKEQAGG